jgi:hypothetical protein
VNIVSGLPVLVPAWTGQALVCAGIQPPPSRVIIGVWKISGFLAGADQLLEKIL